MTLISYMNIWTWKVHDIYTQTFACEDFCKTFTWFILKFKSFIHKFTNMSMNYSNIWSAFSFICSNTYFPLSAAMYSSQDIVLGDGGVRDCLLAGWRGERETKKRTHQGQAWDKKHCRVTHKIKITPMKNKKVDSDTWQQTKLNGDRLLTS